MSGPVPDWRVEDLVIATTTRDAGTDRLYANGRMQVPILVRVAAVDKINEEPYPLQDSDLRKIELFAYDDGPDSLALPPRPTDERPWAATAAQDEHFSRNDIFSNSIQIEIEPDHSSKPVSSARLGLLDNQRNLKYVETVIFVSSAKAETKAIGARIRQPDGTLITTKLSSNNFKVELTGKPPIVYKLKDTNWDREDTADGYWNYYKEIARHDNWLAYPQKWDQDNYYLTSKFHPFVRCDINGQDFTGYAEGHPGDWRLANCYGYWPNDKIQNKTLFLSFIWGLGTKTSVTAGVYTTGSYWDDENDPQSTFPAPRAADAFANITVKQRPNAVCLTRLALDCTAPIWGDKWAQDDVTFTVYDVFGNAGTFKAAFLENHNRIQVLDV